MSQFEQTFEKSLEQYAELVVKVGVNIQKGQDLLVTAPIETLEFTRLIVQKPMRLVQTMCRSTLMTTILPAVVLNMARMTALTTIQPGKRI